MNLLFSVLSVYVCELKSTHRQSSVQGIKPVLRVFPEIALNVQRAEKTTADNIGAAN